MTGARTSRAAAADRPPPDSAADPHLVGADGQLPLPWLQAPLATLLASSRGHALLVHGAPGAGTLAFVLTLAQTWLCEGRGPDPRPCGRCGSCHLVQNHLHPDLFVVLPETLRRAHRWPLATDKSESDDKRKPSRQVRIDDVRGLIDWSTRTSARGQGKVGVVHPAEAMNIAAASALLKTLEEPPVGTRLLLTCADPALLLPTVVSRCQRLRLAEPPSVDASTWLRQQGVDRPDVLLAASSGRPLDALALARSGIDAETWCALPAALAGGQAGIFSGWPVPRVVDALQKVCHDALAQVVGGPGRFFDGALLGTADVGALAAEGTGRGGRLSVGALLEWQRQLGRVARHAEHPWNEALLFDALVQEAAIALSRSPNSAPAAPTSLATLRR